MLENSTKPIQNLINEHIMETRNSIIEIQIMKNIKQKLKNSLIKADKNNSLVITENKNLEQKTLKFNNNCIKLNKPSIKKYHNQINNLIKEQYPHI